jgi:hypothetical protein
MHGTHAPNLTLQQETIGCESCSRGDEEIFFEDSSPEEHINNSVILTYQ